MKGGMMAVAVAGCMGFAGLCDGEKARVAVVSPDGRNEIRLYEAPLSCEVLRDGVTVVGRSRIGLRVNGAKMLQDGRVKSVADRSGACILETPVYKKSSIDLARTGKFVDFGDWGVGLVARNDGVAYRFETKMSGEIAIDDERTDLALPLEASALVYRTSRFGCEEEVPACLRIGDIPTEDGGMIYLPLVYTIAGKTVAVTESDVCDYPCWYLRRGAESFGSVFSKWPKRTFRAGGPDSLWNRKKPIGQRGRWETIAESEKFLVKTAGTRTLPWRVFALADAPSALCASDIVFALARPAAMASDFSWVRPGKVAWDWWNHFDNAPASAPNDGCSTKTYERFIDFASKNGVEYVIFDEGWSAALNIWKFHPRVDVPHLIDYAAKRHVGIILWMAWGQIVGDEDRVAEHFAKLGVKGFKVDFMDRADAQVERFLWRFADACAKCKLIVDYHGAHRPTGMSRVYPNVLNYEGIHGLESMKWFKGEYDMMANDVGAFYGRLTAGPMDYTPGAMDNYPLGEYPRSDKAKGFSINCDPGSEGTRCHQMAMMTLYEAPLQMLSDSPTKYEKNIECFRFMSATPVVWADTVGLGGSFDSYAACARRAKDGAWHAAAINNATGRVITIDTAFLGAGAWQMEIFRDAEDAATNPTHFVHEKKAVKAGEQLTIPLAPGGGFAARFTR